VPKTDVAKFLEEKIAAATTDEQKNMMSNTLRDYLVMRTSAKKEMEILVANRVGIEKDQKKIMR
jgi:hypothetical protein